MIDQRCYLCPPNEHEDFEWRWNSSDPYFEYDFMICTLGSRKEMIKSPNEKYRGGWLRIKSKKPYVREVMESVDWLDDIFTTSVLQFSPWYVVKQYTKMKNKLGYDSEDRSNPLV